MRKILSLYLSLCIFISLIIVPITASASNDILIDESFGTSTRGFSDISRATVTTADALSDGITGKVLEVQSDKSGADYYI